MSVSVRVQVEGVDLAEEATVEAIASADLTSALWSTINGVVTATVFPESADVTDDVVRFARRVACSIPGARVRRVHRDLVSASDVAHRTGFSREAVRKWASGNGERSFPTPYGAVGGDQFRASKIWLWSDVAEWLIANYSFPIDVGWPSEATIAHIEACLAEVPDYVTQEWRDIQVSPDELVLNELVLDHLVRRAAGSRVHTTYSTDSEKAMCVNDEDIRA